MIAPLQNISQIRRGFTLIELLVVMGLIVLLLGVLLPALAGARHASNQATCASNLRQWAIVVNEYALENHQYLPRRGQGMVPITSASSLNRSQDWFNNLPPLIKLSSYVDLVAAGTVPHVGNSSIWICPEANDVQSGFLFTYGMNMWLSTEVALYPDRLDRVGPTSTMVFMADSPSGYCSVLPWGNSAAYNPPTRHKGRVNVAFLDGHVVAIDGAYLGCGTGLTTHDDVRWMVPGSPWAGPS